MGTISLSLPSDATQADVADYNSPLNVLVTELNGLLDVNNLANEAATTSKIANGAFTGVKIADDAAIATAIDYVSTGANGGIWWEELGRATLSSNADTFGTINIEARLYLKIIVVALNTGGTINIVVQFNGDTGNNYSQRYSDNDAADSTGTAQPAVYLDTSTDASNIYSVADVINVKASEKLLIIDGVAAEATGAATSPRKGRRIGKWANTAAQITSVLVTNGGAGDFASGSQVVILGHN